MATTKKAAKKKAKPKPAVAELEGVSASGLRYKVKVELTSLRVNGKKMPAQLSADAIAVLLAQSLKGHRHADV